jgi:opacity protein-like surface antigen
MTNHIRVHHVVCLCCLLLPAASSAQQTQPWSTKGFSVGGHLSIATAGADTTVVDGQPVNVDRVTGVGGGLFLGYGITDWLTIYLNGDGRESGEDLHLTHADIGARYSFLSGQRVRPHLDAAITGKRAEFDTGSPALDTRGAGWTVGGGVSWFLSRSFAFDASLLQSGGALSRFKDDQRIRDVDTVGVNSTRVNIGISWYPGR